VFQYAHDKGVKITTARQCFGLAQGITESNKHMTVNIKFVGSLNGFKQKFFNLNEMPQDLILGRDFLHKAKMQISIFNNGYYCSQYEKKYFPFTCNFKSSPRSEKSERWFPELMHLLQITQIPSQVPPDEYAKNKKFGSYADDSLILLESLEKHAKHLKLVLQELMKFNLDVSNARRKKIKLLFPPPKVRKKIPPDDQINILTLPPIDDSLQLLHLRPDWYEQKTSTDCSRLPDIKIDKKSCKHRVFNPP
jgi:hypothetical protein